jgi:putative ABC transport system permease protein
MRARISYTVLGCRSEESERRILEDAPQARLAAARLPRGDEQGIQDEIAQSFPNITAIRIREVLEKLAEMLNRLALGVRLLGLLTIAAGLAILAGAVSAGEARRGREVALLKTLGMTRRQVTTAFCVEYGLVGLVAGLVGCLAALVLSYFVLTEGMEIDFTARPLLVLAALCSSVLLAVGAGLAASVGALRRRPVEVLRGVGD